MPGKRTQRLISLILATLLQPIAQAACAAGPVQRSNSKVLSSTAPNETTNTSPKESDQSADAALRKAKSLLQQEHYAEAQAILEKIISENKKNDTAEVSLGFALSRSGKTEEAITHFKRAIEIAPSNPGAYMMLHMLYFRQFRIPEAMAVLNALISYCPDSPAKERAKSLLASMQEEAENKDTLVKANALVRARKLPEAQEMFSRISQTYPRNADAQCGLGFTLAQQGKLDEAITHLLKAIELNPDAPEAWNNLATVYQTQGKLQKAIDAYTELLKHYSDGPMAEKARASITLLSKELIKQGRAISNSSTPDYFEQATMGKPRHWSASKMPLKVFVEPAGKLPDYKPFYEKTLRQAFDEWASASRGLVGFSFVNNINEAVIVCRFVNNQEKLSNATEGGETLVSSSNSDNNMEKAQITVLTSTGDSIQEMTEERMHFRCLHEIGHALGLIGHSSDPQDVMFFSATIGDKVTSLSNRDVATLVKLYSLPLATNQTATQAELNQKSIQLLIAGKYLDAIPLLEQAYKMNPDNKQILTNLAQAYNMKALALIKQDKLEQAQATFNQALALHLTPTARQNLMRNAAIIPQLKQLPQAERRLVIDKMKPR